MASLVLNEKETVGSRNPNSWLVLFTSIFKLFVGNLFSKQALTTKKDLFKMESFNVLRMLSKSLFSSRQLQVGCTQSSITNVCHALIKRIKQLLRCYKLPFLDVSCNFVYCFPMGIRLKRFEIIWLAFFSVAVTESANQLLLKNNRIWNVFPRLLNL